MVDDRHSIRVDLDVSVRGERAAAHDAEMPFRIAVLGDFSGRDNRGVVESGRAIAQRHAVYVDRDNFDDALARFAPELYLAAGGQHAPVLVRLSYLDDFHPDRLYERIPVFQAFRQMRTRLADPTTFARAVAELQGPPQRATTDTVPAMPPAAATRPPPANLLDQLVEETEDIADRTSTPVGGDLHDFLKRVVSPHLVPGDDPQRAAMLAHLDGAVTAQLRAILHHPDFQALEALWRAIFFLVRRVETTPALRMYLVDLTKAELEAELAGDRPLQATGLYDLLVESSAGTPGGARWSLFVGAYTFGQAPGDAAVLGRLASLASMAGAPWLSAAHPSLAGWESFASTPDPDHWVREPDPSWEALRRTPDAAFLGLALPRFLLRLPYGEATEPCESFRFEEVDELPSHGDYLWGNPAIACALLLAESFTASGWALHPGSHLDIRNLPLHVVRANGEITAKPCAEALLTDRAVARILERGLMPLVSMRDGDAVRLVRFQSVADPSRPLAGRWGDGAYADRP